MAPVFLRLRSLVFGRGTFAENSFINLLGSCLVVAPSLMFRDSPIVIAVPEEEGGDPRSIEEYFFS